MPKKGQLVWPEEKIIAALQEAGAEKGRWIPVEEWRTERRVPVYETVTRHFPSWGAAWTKAGYPPPEPWGPRNIPRRWTDEQLIESVRRAAGGRPLSCGQYKRWHRQTGEGPCLAILRRRLGLWEDVQRRAGIRVRRDSLTPDALVESVAALWRMIDREPTVRDWTEWPERPCTPETLVKQCGATFSEVKRQVSAQYPVLPKERVGQSLALRRLLRVPRELLTEREMEIALMAETGACLQEIGEAIGLTRERVRQVAMKAGHGLRRGGRRRSYTRAEVIEALRKSYEEIGNIPTIQAWGIKRLRPSVTVILRLFGSWRSAWAEALGACHPEVQAMQRRRGRRVSA